GGISAALDFFDGDLGLLWIDAHADINSPGTTASGNLHGMPIAALAGMASGSSGVIDREWMELQAALVPRRTLDIQSTIWYGLRDVDPAERPRLNGCAITMH